ncbi:MAG TPA: response regulator, partial [Candidatus Binataceae bacterium]|nr:response regulator [Candidatus Binataceae bacterium]
LVLMDCQMPELDGYSASRELRRREGTARHTTIIGVTAHALAGDREECLAAGMDDYIAKPIMAEELAAILEKWVTALNLPAAAQPATGHVEAPPAAEPAILDHAVLAQLREFQHPGEVDFVGDLIGTFLADLARRMELIRAGLERDDSELIRENAHTLRGASAELGARRLSAACARLELAARSGAHDQTRRSAHELVREATLLRAALENARARSPA